MTAISIRPSWPSPISPRNASFPKLDTSTVRTPSRRMTLERTISSPPITPVTASQTHLDESKPRSQPRSFGHDLPTPPISPLDQAPENALTSSRSATRKRTTSSPGSSCDKPSIDEFVLGATSPISATLNSESSLLEYPHDVECLRDQTGRKIEFGSGAWSTVFKCISRSFSTHGESQQKITPTTFKSRSSLVVAVKIPHKHAMAIVQSEARILTHLSRSAGAEDRVVPFHGIVSTTNSLVMSAVPLSLADHITNCNVESQSMYKRNARHVPIVGGEDMWLGLASQLIDTLQWLHEVAGVVHGDIKPHNILLEPVGSDSDKSESSYYQISSSSSDSTQTFPYKPLFADFSSSHLLDSPIRSPGALSAVTPQYTAPELLSTKVLRDPDTLPTRPADVFSLAVTLLTAATGDLNVYPTSNAMQRQAMAQQGWDVIEFSRCGGDGGLRIPRDGVVERVLKRAVVKVEKGRCDAKEWRECVREVGV